MAHQINYAVNSVASITERLRERMAAAARKHGATQVGIDVDGVRVEEWRIADRFGASR